MSGASSPAWSSTDQVRVLIPVFAVGTAIIAALADPSSAGDLVLCALAAAPCLVAAASAGGSEHAGYGLIGMRERATALGGELTAAPTPGGWLVTCTLPLEARDVMPASDGHTP